VGLLGRRHLADVQRRGHRARGSWAIAASSASSRSGSLALLAADSPYSGARHEAFPVFSGAAFSARAVASAMIARMAAESVDALAVEGREAFERGDAEASRDAFERALAEGESGELLEGLGRALYLQADYPGAIAAHQRVFAAYAAQADALAAARAASLLSWLHINVYGDFAVAGGWLARAEELLQQASEERAEHGWVALLRATRESHGEARAGHLAEALDIGRRLGNADLRFAALAMLGEALVMTGRTEQGMTCFDESLAAACGGEVRDLYVVESVFCGMFLTCERGHDVARAEQWLRAAGELVRRRKLLAVGPLCRAHYGGLLTAAGRWEEAEAELDEAVRVFEGGYAAARVIVLIRLADLRVRQGRFEEAAVLLEGLDQIPDAARPLAALHLARGETALARAVLERRLAMPALVSPWPIATTTPPPPPVAGALLLLLVEVHLAAGTLDEAEEAAERLGNVAEQDPGHYLAACAALARGKVCLALGTGDPKALLAEALSAFSRAQMPVELARARLELAKAFAEDEPELAIAESKQALDAFELRRAARDADAAAALLRSLGASGRSAPKGREPLTGRESEVLELLGHGLSNPQIAERLFISRKTVEHHVGSILGKLGLRNRAEAAAYVAREGIGKPVSK
jgi:ATP/maltotriose-dependent transcriptional regulator MalT